MRCASALSGAAFTAASASARASADLPVCWSSRATSARISPDLRIEALRLAVLGEGLVEIAGQPGLLGEAVVEIGGGTIGGGRRGDGRRRARGEGSAGRGHSQENDSHTRSASESKTPGTRAWRVPGVAGRPSGRA